MVGSIVGRVFMISKIYHCNNCDFDFERIEIEGEEVRCPLCGKKDLTLKEEGEKKPASCDINAKYT